MRPCDIYSIAKSTTPKIVLRLKGSPSGLRKFLATESPLKLASAIFYQIFIFHQMEALQKLWKMFFISSKRLFCSRDIQIFLSLSSPLFLLVSLCFRCWSKINLKVYNVINCLNKMLITHYVWYLEKEKRYDIETLPIDRVLNKEIFYGKIMQKMCIKS